jgi:TIR domain-containing protein
MRVFISYASEQRKLAERLALGLRNEGHGVFFDRDALPPGASFDDRIRKALRRSQIFIFLVSNASLQEGSYAQTELNIARGRWPEPGGKVLPVLAEQVAIEELPPYLRAVSVLESRGDVVADVLDGVARLSRERRLALARRVVAVAAVVLGTSVGGWWWLDSHRRLVLEDVNVSAGSQQAPNGGPTFQFDVTLMNRGSEAVTVVGILPHTDNDAVTFSGTSVEWFNINPDERNKTSFVTSFRNAPDSARVRWRLCWEYVRTEDRYYELESGKADVDMFMDRYRREDCSSWRAWSPPPSR